MGPAPRALASRSHSHCRRTVWRRSHRRTLRPTTRRYRQRSLRRDAHEKAYGYSGVLQKRNDGLGGSSMRHPRPKRNARRSRACTEGAHSLSESSPVLSQSPIVAYVPVSDVARARKFYEEYDTPGYKTVNGIATGDGVKSAWFKDTEGNILAIAQRL